MGYKPVVIRPFNVATNTFRDGNRYWNVTNLFERAKSLEVFDLPLCAVDLSRNVFAGMDGNPLTLAGHVQRVQDADLSFPVILDGEGFIMDGWHRVVKALVEGLPTIKAVRFDETPPCDFTREGVE